VINAQCSRTVFKIHLNLSKFISIRKVKQMGYVSLITLIVRIQGTQRSRYLGEYTVTQLYSMVQQIMVTIRSEKT